eukprot:1851223-Prymnesium_polylepis.2
MRLRSRVRAQCVVEVGELADGGDGLVVAHDVPQAVLRRAVVDARARVGAGWAFEGGGWDVGRSVLVACAAVRSLAPSRGERRRAASRGGGAQGARAHTREDAG